MPAKFPFKFQQEALVHRVTFLSSNRDLASVESCLPSPVYLPLLLFQYYPHLRKSANGKFLSGIFFPSVGLIASLFFFFLRFPCICSSLVYIVGCFRNTFKQHSIISGMSVLNCLSLISIRLSSQGSLRPEHTTVYQPSHRVTACGLG